MVFSACKISLATVLLGLCLMPGTSWAQKQEVPRRVQDEAMLFSQEAIDKANGIIASIKSKHRKDLWVETLEEGPDLKQFTNWARERAKNNSINGIYIVITKQPKHFEIELGNQTQESGLFTIENRNELRNILKNNLGKKSDEALLGVANYTLDTMNDHARSKTKSVSVHKRVQDDAKLFSQDAIDRASAIMATIKEKHHKELWVETVEKGPEIKEFTDWARNRARNSGVNGIYVVISKEPKHFEIELGNNTRASGLFTVENSKELGNILKKNLGKNNDEALVKIAGYTLDTMNDHARAGTKANQNPPGAIPPARRDAPQAQTHPWLGWACAGAGVLLLVWVVFAIIRAVSGAGGGAAPGYGGGGGGGGFLTNMLGGLVGAAAGMWLYNNFFGGHSSSAFGSDHHAGGVAGDAGTPPDTDYSSSGGDYGNDAGGGGGGDWGGGGDAGGGGGGDWGGGGGGGDW